MAVPASGNPLSLRSIMDELSNSNYSGTTVFTNISLRGLSDGTVATINTSNDAADRPDGSAPHSMREFYSYDHDVASGPVVPTLSYSTGNIDEVTITWDMATGNTKVYFQLVSSEIGHEDIIAGDYDDTSLEIGGDSFKTSAGSTNLLAGATTVDDDNEDMGTGNFPNKSITIKARGRAADHSYSSFSSNLVAYVAPGPTTGLAASSVSSTAMTISWTAPTGGVRSTNGYRLYHGTNSTWNNNANFDTAVNSSVTSKTYTGLSAGTTYYFGVLTVGDGGDFGRTASMQNGSQATTGGQQQKCFAAGTMITMWDGTYKPIERIQIGDKVFNSRGMEYVSEIKSAVESNIAQFIFSDGTITTNTKDHPYYVIDKGWSSVIPTDHISTEILKIGDICIKDDDTQVSLVDIIDVSNELMTYTFTTNSNTYYANNILVNSVIGNN